MILNKPYTLITTKQITPSVWSYIFKANDGTSVDFTPGMFAMLEYRNESYKVARAFSIANAPPSDYFEFLIALIHGQLTSRLEAAKTGDVYYLSAPYGQFKFDIESASKLLFLAGGTGLAPFLSMLRQAKSLSKKIDCVLLYSVKYPDEIINKEELNAMGQELGMKLTVTVTRPKEGDGWNGETGHVDAEMILRHTADFKERTAYICGPPAFVKGLKEALVSLGVNERSIKAEMWGE